MSKMSYGRLLLMVCPESELRNFQLLALMRAVGLEPTT